ncbi:MAG TPA: hypothetical protein VGD08_13255 [Stellaceae bacterium]|jgi:hypothetical protein
MVRETGAGGNRGKFDWALREHVTESVSEFLKKLDTALTDPAPENIDALRNDSDRAMRAIARVRLELERLADERG